MDVNKGNLYLFLGGSHHGERKTLSQLEPQLVLPKEGMMHALASRHEMDTLPTVDTSFETESYTARKVNFGLGRYKYVYALSTMDTFGFERILAEWMDHAL